MVSSLPATHAALGNERPLQDLRGDTIALTQSVFSDAKKVIKICAYINVIANMSGEQQMTEAAALLDGGHDVPKSLNTQLQALVSTRPAKRAKKD